MTDNSKMYFKRLLFFIGIGLTIYTKNLMPKEIIVSRPSEVQKLLTPKKSPHKVLEVEV